MAGEKAVLYTAIDAIDIEAEQEWQHMRTIFHFNC